MITRKYVMYKGQWGEGKEEENIAMRERERVKEKILFWVGG